MTRQPRESGSRYRAPTTPFWRSQLPTLREPGRLLMHAAALVRAPSGSEPIMVFPGFRTDDRITWLMRRYLKSRGHTVVGWELGRNRGDVSGDIEAVRERVKTFHQQVDGQPLTLIGWSLGGVFAREIARDNPELVAQVMTIATPVFSGPRFTRSADAYTPAELDQISARTERRNLIPIVRPITAFFSRRDGIVDWRTCLDEFSPDLTMVEVTSSHVGSTCDATIWLRIAQLLATRPPA